MNARFAETTTGIAFVLTLSKRQCNTLLRVKAHEDKFGKPQYNSGVAGWMERGSGNKESPAHHSVVQTDSLKGLCDRGLVFWFTDHKGEPNGFGGLTRAGELMAYLLIEAGMTIESTNTLSVLKRLGRAA